MVQYRIPGVIFMLGTLLERDLSCLGKSKVCPRPLPTRALHWDTTSGYGIQDKVQFETCSVVRREQSSINSFLRSVFHPEYSL